MMKSILVAFTLTVLVGLTVQQDNVEKDLFLSTCGSDISVNTCCVQSAHILAYTAAATAACADAIAAAESSASIAVGSGVAVAVAVAVAADVSVSQSVAISVGGVGGCCQISTEVQAQANSSALAASVAAAQAQAGASAAAAAAAAAASQAASATQLLVQANALINSSCCNFTAELTSLIQIVAQFAVEAQAAAATSVGVASSIQVAASAAVEAAANASAGASAFVSNSLSFCCNSTTIRVRANATAVAAARAADYANQTAALIENALQIIAATADDANQITNIGQLSDKLCQNRCGSAEFTCCDGPGECNSLRNSTVCDISVSITNRAFLFSAAKASAAVAAAAAVETAVFAFAEAAANASAAARAATVASSAITVTVFSCCSINIRVDTVAIGRASAIAQAFASAKAAAFAYGNATSAAVGLAVASSIGISVAQASATILTEGNNCNRPCCRGRRYPQNGNNSCCAVLSGIVNSYSLVASKDCDAACASSSTYIEAIVKSVESVKATTIVDVIRRSNTKTLALVQLNQACCCCQRSTTLGSTSRIDISSRITATLPSFMRI